MSGSVNNVDQDKLTCIWSIRRPVELDLVKSRALGQSRVVNLPGQYDSHECFGI